MNREWLHRSSVRDSTNMEILFLYSSQTRTRLLIILNHQLLRNMRQAKSQDRGMLSNWNGIRFNPTLPQYDSCWQPYKCDALEKHQEPDKVPINQSVWEEKNPL